MRFAFFGSLEQMAFGIGDGGLAEFSKKMGKIVKRTTSDFGPPIDCQNAEELQDLCEQMEKLVSICESTIESTHRHRLRQIVTN